MDVSVVVVVTIAVALAFDIINGFHDAANSIATVVSTRVLSPRFAVLWAAFFNFVALFIFHTGVAKTIAGIIKITATDPAFVWVVMAGLLGAITWNLLTWWWGLPSSSSHALIGGVGGAGVAYGGWDVLVKAKVYKVLEFIIIAPLIGFLLGGLIMLIVFWLFRKARPQKVDRTFRVGQLMSAAAYSIGHGGNDAQKTMGIILAVLVAGGHLPAKVDSVPMWIVLSSYGCMAFGTAIGGWRIVKTMGMGLTHLKPVGGFCAEVAGAITLFVATNLKIPVSTTHTITGAIIGVGSVTKLRGIRWGLAGRIVWAWVLTIPAAAAVGAIMTRLFDLLGAW
ncbi:MAG: inorganic phosphate transporter [Kofleriaceae bacterium]|jgi:PiT family inorganic phosphate transporter|nr:inorganic phosphate transporter [Kofleriaceae bacterium]MBP6836027.1 inorganic phosphate transporter [Kofleriaceae bacterium]MBP9207722.1 inorganic phosphate transporter [Kofleriaceae bacterium]